MTPKKLSAVNSLWLAIESATERCDGPMGALWRTWQRATYTAHEQELEHRRAVGPLGSRHFSVETAARYFAVKWFLGEYTRCVESGTVSRTIAVVDIIQQRLDVVLARAVALHLLACKASVQVDTAHIEVFQTIDYAEEMER